MSNETQVIVLKFGSSVLRTEDDLPAVVHRFYRWWRTGHHVVAVVSAFGNTTDDLTRRAYNVCDAPEDALVAALGGKEKRLHLLCWAWRLIVRDYRNRTGC